MSDEPEIIQVEKPKKIKPKCSKFKVVNGQVVCLSCDCTHTVNIDPNKIDVIQSN